MWKRRVGIVKRPMVFRTQYVKTGTKRLMRDWFPPECGVIEALGTCQTQRPRIRRQVANTIVTEIIPDRKIILGINFQLQIRILGFDTDLGVGY